LAEHVVDAASLAAASLPSMALMLLLLLLQVPAC
jgi:hypothetical protein